MSKRCSALVLFGHRGPSVHDLERLCSALECVRRAKKDKNCDIHDLFLLINTKIPCIISSISLYFNILHGDHILCTNETLCVVCSLTVYMTLYICSWKLKMTKNTIVLYLLCSFSHHSLGYLNLYIVIPDIYSNVYVIKMYHIFFNSIDNSR